MFELYRRTCTVALAALLCGAVHAEEPPVEAGDTMMIIEQGMTPEDIVGVIELPQVAPDTARERAQRGHDTANAAREERSGFGRARAAEVQAEAASDRADSAREHAADAADQAREHASEAADAARQAAEEIRDDVREHGRPDDRPGRAGGGV